MTMIDTTGQFPDGIGPQPLTIAERMQAHRGAMRLSYFAVEIMAVSYDTGYKWVREYGLPASKIAGTYWIDPQLAARWWTEHMSLASAADSLRSGKKRLAASAESPARKMPQALRKRRKTQAAA